MTSKIGSLGNIPKLRRIQILRAFKSTGHEMSLRHALSCLLLTAFSAFVSADESSVHKDGLRENLPDVWALQHATVVVQAGTKIEDATVVIRKGRIASIVAGGKVPADARTIDMTGKTIYPGFIDAYAETEIPGYQLKQTAGYWNPNVLPQLSVARRLTENKDASSLRKQGFVAQLRAPGNGIIRGQSAVVSTGTDDPSKVVLASEVAQHMQLTLSRRGRDTYPGSPMGAVALARQAMYDSQWYKDAWAAANADLSLPRPERNVALSALEATLSGAQPVMVECSSDLYVLRADRFAAEFGLNLIIRGSGQEYRRLEDIAATKRPIILPLNFPKPPNVSTPEVADNASLESLMHWDLAPENPARVHGAGITFAFTTNRLESIDKFLASIRKAVERGLPADAALDALTVTPAGMYGVQEHLGTVAAGKLASFVITDGDLFESKTKVVETWVDGTRFRHSPDPVHKLEGSYHVKLKTAGKYPKELFVELSRKGSTVSGRISQEPLPDKKSKADSKADDEETEDTDKSKEAAKKKTKKAKAKEERKKSKDADKQEDADDKADESPVVVDLKNASMQDFAATAQFKADKFGDDGIARLSLLFSEKRQPGEMVGVGQVVWPSGQVATATIIEIDATKKDDSKSKTAEATPDSDKDSDSEEDDAAEDDTDSDKDGDKASFPVNYPLGAFGRNIVPSQAKAVAFTNATIWTCGPEGIIEGGTLLIENGKITAVGKDVKLPKKIQTIDLEGSHITPGIIDCHSHMASDGGINESTQSITCEVRIGDFIDCDDITIYRQLAGGVTAANILHGSANPIGGQNQVIKLRWGVNDEAMKFAEAPQGVKFALGENVKQANWGDDYTTRYPQTRMGVEQLFRDAFVAAKEYGARMDDWNKNKRGLPPRRDLELDALLEMVQGTRWIHCHSYRQDEILALIRVLDEHDITIGTFQHILEGYKVADAMAKHGAMGSAFSDWWAYKFEVYDAIPYGGALMHEAGVVVSFNSDDAELGTRLNLEAAKAVKYGGVDEEEALKFVTLNPAKQLRVDEYVGSLETGKQADFAVWNGHPLSSFSRCEQTWIDGTRYFDRKEDATARKIVAEQRNTLIQKILASGEKMEEAGRRSRPPGGMWPRHDEYCHHSKDKEANKQN